MYSAHRSVRAVALLFVCSVSGAATFPQSANLLRNAADPLSVVNLPPTPIPCASYKTAVATTPGAAIAASDVGRSTCDIPAASLPAVNPCNLSNPIRKGCGAPRDEVQEELAAMGKPGQKIMRARERVLEILQSENACSAWYRGKDQDPADTFRTLSYTVDRVGENFVMESRNVGDEMNLFRNPYVAKVFQGDGRYARVTINFHGAFFSPVAGVVEVWKDGGPVNHRGPRMTNVGPYAGDTMHAQVLVLLHEFGHVVDLLPADGNNVDGKSVQNTNEVLRFCRAEIESKVKRGVLSAMR